MKKFSGKIPPILVAIAILLLAPAASLAQEASPAPKPVLPAAEQKRADALESVSTLLLNIFNNMQKLKGELAILEVERGVAESPEEKAALGDEIREVNAKIAGLREDFERIAAGVSAEVLDARPQEEFDFKEELSDLLEPILLELKQMTERPRKIERLRSEITAYKQKEALIGKSIAGFDALIASTDQAEFQNSLQKLKRDWEAKSQQVSNHLAVLNHQLAETQNSQVSFMDSTQNIIRTFFKSRGKNFLLAMMSFLFVFLGLRLLHRLIHRVSPFHKKERKSFFVRLGDVLYYLFSVIGATFVMLGVLYASGDWLLLSIAIIFIFGILWAAKRGLLQFWEQLKLLLNLGSVREGERVVYNGIPWRVASLSIYSFLENPLLRGGRTRLPLNTLKDMYSRPFHPEEPWFPCRQNDWVLLDDDIPAKVVSQGPDLVETVLLGGSHKTYLTSDFLAKSPENLSTGFRLRQTFGVDYKHQAQVTAEIPRIFEEKVRAGLEEKGYGKKIMDLKVEFKEAGASSLDLKVIVDMSGECARDYRKLQRLLQRLCVDACNEHGYVIPFTQLTLHAGGS